MLLAEVLEAVDDSPRFFMFDVFMVLFTIIIAIGLYRLLKAPKRNVFALGFTTVCLLIFLAADVLMAMNWFDKL